MDCSYFMILFFLLLNQHVNSVCMIYACLAYKMSDSIHKILYKNVQNARHVRQGKNSFSDTIYFHRLFKFQQNYFTHN